MTAALFAVILLAMARAAYVWRLERVHAARFRVSDEGIIDGAEPIDLKRAGAPAVLVLHGGGDTPQSVRDLAAHIHSHGFAVRVPLLARHGRSIRELRRFDGDEWRDQVRAELASLAASHPSVSLVGQSLGGALALDAATGSTVRALVLLAPWVAMAPKVRALAAASALWGPLIPYLPSMGSGSIHDAAARSRALTRGVVTPGGLRALAAMARAADAALPKVRVPTLMMSSHNDHRIPAPVTEAAFAKLGSPEKRLEWIDEAGHVLSVDRGRERVFAFATDWLESHARG